MQHYSSSPSLSSPPSALSEPGSPTRFLNAGRANIEMDEIIVDPGSAPRFGIMQQHTEPAPSVPLTAAGVPRKKPGRKPGSTVKPKVNPDGTPVAPAERKPRRPRKIKDSNEPPVERKRKAGAAVAEGSDVASEADSRSASGPQPTPPNPPTQPKITELMSMRLSLDARPAPPDAGFVQTSVKRESAPGSMLMQNLLNNDPPPKPQPAAPARQMFDPIRGNYDPIRESMVSRDPYGTGPLGSPRAPSQVVNRASASPSIASLVDPTPANNVLSPMPHNTYANGNSHTTNPPQPRFQESTSVPPSPSHPPRTVPHPIKPTIVEAKRPPPPPPPPTSVAKTDPPAAKTNSFTSMTSIPAGSSLAASGSAPQAQSKKVAAVVQQERESNKKARSSSSSPKVNSLRDSAALPPLPSGSDRSILDFGRANPGEEVEAPSIKIHISIKPGENNKYVNFLRMAEEQYGWDALHPRQAANRERKARIAAASAALEKEKSGRESGDEDMDEDLQSDAGDSNVEMGGMNTSAAATATKPARKKRNFKEDEYDKDDDFVDDSEMLWEEQAAASRDGFFVYSGPLIPEVEKVVAPPPRRGRGSRGGGRARGGGTTRGDAAAAKGRGDAATGRGRGGGPGSRGGAVRKPRITKVEKEQRDQEKAERERLANLAAGKGISSNGLLGVAGVVS